MAYLALARRIEHATDAKAIDLGARPQALITGLARLSRLSQVPPRWPPVQEWLLTHPSLERRALRVAARTGLDPASLIELMDHPPASGPRWEMPAAVASPRAFSSEFRQGVIRRITWPLLGASALAPALVILAARDLPVPRLAVLALAASAGFAAWQIIWLVLAHSSWPTIPCESLARCAWHHGTKFTTSNRKYTQHTQQPGISRVDPGRPGAA